jgi:ketosteroid isomerase-like protein
MTEAQQVFARSLELLGEGRIEEWVDLFAPDGVLEFPAPPIGFAAELRGHDALRMQMGMFASQMVVRFSPPTFHDTVEEDLVIAEFTSDSTLRATGTDYRQTYVSLVWFRDGKIVRYRDFWDPWALMAAAGGEQAWRQAMAAAQG